MKVTTITRNASQDPLADEYMNMYEELRAGKGLRAFCQLIGSVYTSATWSKVERGLMPLNRTMKQELRAALKLPPLPPTVTEAVASVSPDAHVVRVTDAETPDRLILAFSGDEPLTIHLSGEIVAQPAATSVASQSSAKPRRAYYRPCIDPAHGDLSSAEINAILSRWKEQNV